MFSRQFLGYISKVVKKMYMYIFQSVSFILEIFIYLFVGGFIAIHFNRFIKGKINEPIKYINYYKVESCKYDRKRILSILVRSFFIIVVMGITIYFSRDYLLDFPKLIKGDFQYVTGYVDMIKKERKQSNEYVYIEGKKLNFCFTSGVETGKKYKIGYLPNTSRAIYGEVIDSDAGIKNTKIKFPHKGVLLYILGIGSIILIILLSPYLKFKLLIIVSAFFYPINILLYIKEGLTSGAWFSFSNVGLLFLTIGVGSIIFLRIMYLVERKEEMEYLLTLVITQFMCGIKIFLLIKALGFLLEKS